MSVPVTLKRTTLQLAVSTALFSLSSVALSQQVSTEEVPATLEQIVVTANRVQTSAQETAVALSAYSGDDIADAGVANIVSLQSIDPSVNITTSNGTAWIAMRGIASADVTEIGDPSVPIAREGFFTNRSYSVFSSFYDVERIEILKGPQGTLFGRNATGGLITITTNKPSDELEGKVSIELGNYGTQNLEGMLNIPLSDSVQFRVAGIKREHDGYRSVEPVGLEGDDENSWSVRAMLAFAPNDDFNGWISYQKDKVDQVGDLGFNSPLETDINIADINTDTYTGYGDVYTKIDGKRIQWLADYRGLPWGLEAVYTGGIDEVSWDHALDASTDPVFTSNFLQSERPKTTNHELRFATDQSKPLTAQFGYFYFKEENGPLNSGLYFNLIDTYLIKFDYQVDTKSTAFFGQLGYQLTDDIKVTAGVRRTHDQKHRTGTSALDCTMTGIPAFICTGEPPKLITQGNGDLDDSQNTYHLGVEWKPVSQSLVYAKYDTGYKSGGFNSNGSAPSVPYGAEDVKTVELGVKNDLFDNRLRLNAALYHTNYEGYQASQFTEVLSNGSQGVFNVGSATITGLEAQLIALLGDNGRFDLNATFTDATFDTIADPIVDGAGNGIDISGNDLPNAPKSAFTAAYEHTFPLESGDIVARIDGKYSDAFYYSAFNTSDTRSDAYATANLSVSYMPLSGAWQVQGFIRNVTDETVLALATRNYNVHLNSYQLQPPRTYGVKFTYFFGM